MKIKLLAIVIFILSTNLSCSLFFRDKYMFDQNNLEEAFAVVKSKGFAKIGLDEIDITHNKVGFDTGTRKIAYAKGLTREVKSESSSASKKFQLDEIDISNLHKIITAAIERAKKNPYIDNPEISRIVITKQSVSRDDNLVSNVGKQRDAIRCEVYIVGLDTGAQYTTNLQGEIVDVLETNAKPRPNFLDANQMKKSLAEIKLLFGGKMSVANFSIDGGSFSFTAPDPQNPDEINDYRFNSQEFLKAGKSMAQKTLEDKKRDEEMRRGGTPEETIQMRYIEAVFFDVEEIDFSLISQVMQKTLETAQSSKPTITGIIIRKRQDQFTKVITLEWRVGTVGDRSEKESVTFDGKGSLINEGK